MGRNAGFSGSARILAVALMAWAAPASADPLDLMSFAQGTLPVAIVEGAEAYRVTSEHAIAAIDGNPRKFSAMGKPMPADGVLAITYALAAPTVFDSFAVPRADETPSPSQTAFGRVEVLGATDSPDGPFIPLAAADMPAGAEDGDVTPLTMAADQPQVRWVQLRLSGGVDVQRDTTFMEFTELVGTGTQADAPLAEGFGGVWAGRGVKLEMAQDGATVTGCYDDTGSLAGTVDGRVLRALGETTAGIASQFILVAAEDGTLQGLRSTNGAPFKPYNGESSDRAPRCLDPEPPSLGCGSVVHGIRFGFDSAEILSSSRPVLQDLFDGLAAEAGAQINIIGHSSSEGAEDYNRALSERRAQSVVAALVALGLDADRLSATGRGEDAPIASNADEAGRSMNRRVEISCAG